MGSQSSKEEYEWFLNGNYFLQHHKYTEALECYQKVINKNPWIPSVWNNKGISLQHLQRYEESLQSFDEAIKIDPGNSEAWHNKGYLLKEVNKCEESIKSFDEAIKIDPDNPSAWLNKGVCYKSLKQFEEARQCYAMARELNSKKKPTTIDPDNLTFDLNSLPQTHTTYQPNNNHPAQHPINPETQKYHPNSNPYRFQSSAPSHPLTSPEFPDPNSYHPDKATTTAPNIYYQEKNYPNTYGEDFPGSEDLKKKKKKVETPFGYVPRLWTPQQILDAMGPEGPPIKAKHKYFPDNYPDYEQNFKFK